MSFKILNMAEKCSGSFFLKAPIRHLLKRTKASMGICLTPAEMISMVKLKKVLLESKKGFLLRRCKKIYNIRARKFHF